MKPLHVCFVADPLTANLQSWVRGLTSWFGVDVTILAVGSGLREVAGARVVDLPLPDWIGPVRYGLVVPALRREARRIAPDLVIGYRVPSYGVLAYLSGVRPFVLAAQGEHEYYPPAIGLKRVLVHHIAPRADLIHVWAETMEPWLLEAGASPERILRLPRGVDLDVFDPGRTLELQPFPGGAGVDRNPARPARLVVTRTLNDDYRHRDIFHALARLRAGGFEASIDVIGDGALSAELRALAGLVIPGAARFHGRCGPEVVAAILRESDLYISVPIAEGLSASLVEAMACGTYPIVTDHPGNRVLVRDGVNGSLVAVGDEAGIAQAIRKAWEDPGLRGRAVVANRRSIEENFSARRNLGVMVERWRSIVAT